MKKHWKKVAMVVAFLLISIFYKESTGDISPNYFGQNAWMPDTVGNYVSCPNPPCYKGGKLHFQWQNVKQSGTKIVRYGGIGTDENKPTNFQYLRIIDSIKSNGMEPIIQVPFNNWQYNASDAASIVQYLNITKGRNIKYWIIGNEPNLGYSYHTASQIANYIRPFASAMKAVDPTIKIIGPEVAWYEYPVMNGLMTPGGPDDITGKDAAGRYYIDIISFHSYSFDGSQTRGQVISKLTSTGIYGLQSILTSLNSNINACNLAHNRTGVNALQTAITEANIGWQNPSTDNLYGLGANSFIGGQFVAEMLGIGLKNDVQFVNLWSIIEGNTIETNNGFIDPTTGNKKPLYYHFQLMANNFSGLSINSTSNKPNVKVFSCKNSSEIVVILLNEDSTANFNFTLKLDNSTISGTDPLKINTNASLPILYNDEIFNQSTILLAFNLSGILIRKCEYKISDAALNNPPTCTTYSALNVGSDSEDNFDYKVYPNPSDGNFTIELNPKRYTEKEYQINIVNILGQEVFNKKVVFIENKALIQLEYIRSGTYIISIENNKKIISKKIIIN